MPNIIKVYICALLTLLCLSGCSEQLPVKAPETTAPATTAPVKTGWDTAGTAVCYYDPQGKPVTGWQEIDEKRYYFDDSGIMQTGWLEQEQDRYYFLDDGVMAVGEVEIDGVANFFTSKGKHVLLVNFENAVAEDYEPELTQVRGYKIDESCADALEQLLQDCEDAGYKCKINSAYRSIKQQENLWNKRYQQYRDAGYSKKSANEKTAKSVAKPGYSEHQLGLAADIGGSAKMQKWLKDHAWEYGFIVRYPEGKTEYTGIIHEPWHIRYVGKELAEELYTLDLCMEEYMESLTKNVQ